MKLYTAIFFFCCLTVLFYGQNPLIVTLHKTDAGCYKATASVDFSGGSGLHQVKWSTGDSSLILTDLMAGTYTVMVKDDTKDTTITFTIEAFECEVRISNHFTPNGDGFNDTWNIGNISFYPNFELIVFNRWGQQVYKQTELYIPWDGKAIGINLPDATYYYIFYFDKNSKDKVLKGDVSILR